MNMRVLNARPLPSTFDDELWMPLSYVESLEELVREDMREKNSLRGYMATIRDLWKNIPEKLEDRPWAKTPDSFRKFALIKTGHCDVDIIGFGSNVDAIRGVSRIAYMARMGHGFAVTQVVGDTVHCITPHTQKLSAMTQTQFDESKKNVLNWCCDLVGVSLDELKNARKGSGS